MLTIALGTVLTLGNAFTHEQTGRDFQQGLKIAIRTSFGWFQLHRTFLSILFVCGKVGVWEVGGVETDRLVYVWGRRET